MTTTAEATTTTKADTPAPGLPGCPGCWRSVLRETSDSAESLALWCPLLAWLTAEQAAAGCEQRIAR